MVTSQLALTGRMAKRLAVLSVAFAMGSLPAFGTSPAFAGDAETEGAEASRKLEARQAYDRGAEAYDDKEYAVAAAEFARADELVPNNTVLEVAMKAVLKVDSPVLGMKLVERAEGREPKGKLAELTAEAREKYESRVGKLIIICPEPLTCTAKVDATPVEFGDATWVEAGDHRVELVVDGKVQKQKVKVDGGATVRIRAKAEKPEDGPPKPPPPKPKPVEEDDGKSLSPIWFWVGTGLTLGLGAASLASGLDTKSKHEDFDARPTEENSDAGKGSQLRTNILFGATAVSAVATVAIGAFLVDWNGDSSESPAADTGLRVTPSFGVAQSGASLFVTGTY